VHGFCLFLKPGSYCSLHVQRIRLTVPIGGAVTQARLGCNSELILDEFGEKLLEELDYQQEARNIEARPELVQLICLPCPACHAKLAVMTLCLLSLKCVLTQVAKCSAPSCGMNCYVAVQEKPW
jgi:hypothetical protein